MSMKYSHIIWDWNGTLLDDAGVCRSVINTLLAARGLKTFSNVDEYRDVFGFPVKKYYESIGFDFESEPFELVAEEYMALYRAKTALRLHEGASRALRAVRAAGISQILLSASQKDDLTAQVGQFDIRGCFDGIFGNEDIYAVGKLDIARACVETIRRSRAQDKRRSRADEAYLSCADKDYLASERGAVTLFIGDTEHDAEVAAALGADCLLLSCGHQKRERLIKTGFPVLDTVSEVPGFLWE